MNNETIARQNAEQEEQYFLMPLIEGLADLTPQKLVQRVLDGFKSPITAMEEIHHLQDILKTARQMIEDDAAEEIEKYGKDHVPTVLGYKIGIRAGRRMYKYNDQTIQVAKQRVKELEECAKKGLPTSDGELLEAPQITHTKDSIVFSRIK